MHYRVLLSLVALVISAVNLFYTNPLLAIDRRHIESAKVATAFVVLENASKYGSAFCIHDSGIFITNAHVVKDAGINGELKLVMNSGSLQEKTLEAVVIRLDEKSDLALLRCKTKLQFKPLVLGGTGDIFETMSLVTFGYPFGKALAAREKNPNITVNMGRVTSMTRENGAVGRIQLDAQVNPGNSGGPVINDKGEVVGIISSGVFGTGLYFAIPVEKITRMLQKPDVDFKPPTYEAGKLGLPRLYRVNVNGFDKSVKYQVTLNIKSPSGGERSFAMKSADGRTFISRVQLKEKMVKQEKLIPVRLSFDDGAVSGTMYDQKLKVDEGLIPFSSIKAIDLNRETGKASEATKISGLLLNGKEINGRLSDDPQLRINLSKLYAISVDLKRVKRFELGRDSNNESDGDYQYTLVIKSGSRVVDKLEGIIFSDGSVHQGGDVGSTVASEYRGEDQVIKLPGTCHNVLSAAAGRYLLLHMNELRKIAVFDLSTFKISGYLNLTSENVLLAAGAKSLIVVYPDENIIQRWNLETRKRELTKQVPISGVVKSIAMGNASNTMLLHWAKGTSSLDRCGYQFFDTTTMREIKVSAFRLRNTSYRNRVHIRVSSDGRVYSFWCSSHSPQGLESLVLNGMTATVKYDHTSTGSIVPDKDGKYLYTSSGRIFTNGLRHVNSKSQISYPVVPSYHPSYFLAVPSGYSRSSRDKKPLSVAIYTSGSTVPLLTLPELAEMGDAKSSAGSTFNRSEFTLEKRYHYYPFQNILITIPHSNDRMVLRRLNLGEALNKKGIDYLYTVSSPPNDIKKGQQLRYQINVRSKAGGVKYRLEAGPKGAKLSSGGLLSWRAMRPAVMASGKRHEVSFIVVISDQSNQEIFHTFKMTVN